jgi:hypothetical protein
LRRDPRIARDCARDAWWLSGRCNHWIPDVLFASVSDRITFNGRHLSAQEMLPEALPAVERHEVILRRGVSGLVFAVDRLEDGHVAGRVVSGSVFVRVGDIPYSFPDLKLPPTARDGLIIGPARPGRKPDDSNDLPARFCLGDRERGNWDAASCLPSELPSPQRRPSGCPAGPGASLAVARGHSSAVLRTGRRLIFPGSIKGRTQQGTTHGEGQDHANV